MDAALLKRCPDANQRAWPTFPKCFSRGLIFEGYLVVAFLQGRYDAACTTGFRGGQKPALHAASRPPFAKYAKNGAPTLSISPTNSNASAHPPSSLQSRDHPSDHLTILGTCLRRTEGDDALRSAGKVPALQVQFLPA